MATFDLPLDQLRGYRPDLPVPDDLDDFWRGTVAAARQHEVVGSVTLIDSRLRLVDTYDVTYAGYDGTPVRAWLHVPAGATGPLPTVALYHGYSGGRGFPFANTLFAQAGYAQLTMDTRGQSYSGGGWETTPDVLPDGRLTAQSPGQMTRGILDPEHYYYRRAHTDALRLLDLAAALPQCDASQLVVTGGSQGGGLAIAAAGLAGLTDTPLVGAQPDVPFLCDFPRAISLVDSRPYGEIGAYLAAFREHVDPALRTLSYFDGAILGRWARVPTMFSVGLMDTVCPPSTCFAAYNWWGDGAVADSDKTVEIYRFNNHEGGGDYQRQRALDWIRDLLG